MYILFLSNGYGEDTIAYYIINSFPSSFKNRILTFPLVTEGKIFEDNGIKRVGPIKVFPSRGISGIFNLKNMLLDIKSGLIKHILKQIKFLNSLDENYYFVAVGDIYPLSLLYLSNKIDKTFFVATAKSIRTENFNFFEIFLMNKTIANFVRDQETYQKFEKRIKNLFFVGNPVLDIPYYEPPEEIRSALNKSNSILIFPGREDQALNNLKLLLPSIEVGVQKGFLFFIVVPNFYPIDQISAIVGYKDAIFVVDSRYLAYLLKECFVVWGFGGSVNEQAAGFGIPVISLDQKNWYRRRQRKLLGNSLILVSNSYQFIQKTLELKQNKQLYLQLSNEGRVRMGKQGGALSIVNLILEKINV
ncbi:MAG: hypothetical protein ABDH21_01140 [bacterium]